MTAPAVLTTLEYLGLTVEVFQIGERRGGRSLALRLAGTHIDLGQYEVTTLAGAPAALDETHADWDACYSALVVAATRLHVARQLPALKTNSLQPGEWICVMPAGAYLGQVRDGLFEIVTPSGAVVTHALSSVRGLVTAPGVGCWRTIDQAARDLLLLAALDGAADVQVVAA